MVCHFMVSQRGVGQGSHIAGPSTHNQCIERLWRDVYHCVASIYHELFYYMEEEQLLDPENELDLFVLHCIFLPKINHALECFSSAWNQHSLRTEQMWSLRKIWINGMLRDSSLENDVIAPGPELEMYGIDPDGPVPEVHQQVDVPDTIRPLDTSARQRFVDSLQQEQDSDRDYGVRNYCTAKKMLQEILECTTSSSNSVMCQHFFNIHF